jgi:hypothetical protein
LPIWPAVAGDFRADITQLEHLLFVVKRGRSPKQSVMRFRLIVSNSLPRSTKLIVPSDALMTEVFAVVFAFDFQFWQCSAPLSELACLERSSEIMRTRTRKLAAPYREARPMVWQGGLGEIRHLQH